MKKKIIIGSILAVILMLSMPMISSIQAQTVLTTEINTKKECQSCRDSEPPAYYVALCKIEYFLIVFIMGIIKGLTVKQMLDSYHYLCEECIEAYDNDLPH